MKTLVFLFMIICFSSCLKNRASEGIPNKSIPETSEQKKDSLIQKYLVNGAWKHDLFSQEWQEKINEGIAEDSTIAYFWQQKAMPLYKQGKYELGLPYLDKAAHYEPHSYLPYKAFMKCIFAKQYTEAIRDFEECVTRFGNSLVMDHSYNFYIALSNLQLNKFERAEELLTKDIQDFEASQGYDFIHNLDLFYLGISQFEQKKYDLAINNFNRSLEKYPNFAEAQYYKSKCLRQLGEKVEANELLTKAIENGQKGNSINEDNVIYVRYPYQIIRWE